MSELESAITHTVFTAGREQYLIDSAAIMQAEDTARARALVTDRNLQAPTRLRDTADQLRPWAMISDLGRRLGDLTVRATEQGTQRAWPRAATGHLLWTPYGPSTASPGKHSHREPTFFLV